MVRATNLFAAASATLLILGLILSNFVSKRGMSITWPGSNTLHVIGLHVPCYGLAGLFAIFAFSYALRWIPANQAIIDWHLWLSFSGVVMFGTAFALFSSHAIENPVREPSQWALLSILGGLILGPTTFVVGQLLLLIASIRSIAIPHH